MKTNFNSKKIVIVLLAFTITTTNLVSQEESNTKTTKLSGGFGHFNFSGQQINIGGLNNLFATNGYGSINSFQSSWGGGGNFAIKNFLIGGEGLGYFNSKTSNALNTINFNGGYGFLNVGYIVYSNKRSVLYPIIGVGTGGYNISISQKDQSKNFQEQLNSPKGNTTVSAGGLLLKAEIAYQYFFSGQEKQGFFIGLKAGYHYSPGPWKLKVNGTELNDSPNINMNGLYATIILGGGALFKK